MVNPLKYLRNRKVGLALGSGGAKGISHISVIEYLNEMQIPISMIAGSSIGAVVGALYSAGKLDEFKRDLLAMNTRKMVSFFDPVFPRSGLLEGVRLIDFLAKYIPRDTRIEDLNIPLAVMATDFISGKSVVFRNGKVLDSLRASFSIPGIFKPVNFKNSFLVDGGVANPLPVNICRMMGAGLTIAVNLHPAIKPGGWGRFLNKEIESAEIIEHSFDMESRISHGGLNSAEPEPVAASWFKSLDRWIRPAQHEEKLPSIFEVIFQSINIMELVNTKHILKSGRPDVLIEPDLPEVGTLDFNKAQAIIAEGYRAASAARGKLIRNIRLWS